jgi:hypothetical protein
LPCFLAGEVTRYSMGDEKGTGYFIKKQPVPFFLCGAYFRGEGGEQERELAAKYRARAERLHFDYPYVGGGLEEIAASYDHEAGWQDSEAKITKRLRF